MPPAKNRVAAAAKPVAAKVVKAAARPRAAPAAELVRLLRLDVVQLQSRVDALEERAAAAESRVDELERPAKAKWRWW